MTAGLMRSYYEAYNSGDADELSAILDPDVVLVSAMGTQSGRDAYLATYRFMTGQFIDRMEPQQIDAVGEVVTVCIRDTLIARADIADFLGQPVSKGQQLVLDLIGRYTVRDGRITRIELTPAE
jgi:ketosteroid isomerase-like protein